LKKRTRGCECCLLPYAQWLVLPPPPIKDVGKQAKAQNRCPWFRDPKRMLSI
jgi:hypothetical protein